MPAWKAPPFKLYSTAPAAPVAVAVNMVVLPLQVIVPAEAVNARLHAGAAITCIEVVPVLSEVLSPANVPGVVHDVPLENNREPLTVEGPPIAVPVTLMNI